jgi:O-methyltransferase domain
MAGSGAHESATPAPAAQVTSIIMGKIGSAAVSALAKLGVPDHLESGPKTVEELADFVHAKPDLLRRLMRATEAMGILAQASDGKWAQTPMSDVLRTNSAKSLRDLAIFYADEWHSSGFGSLDATIRTGEPAMERLYGLPYFEFFHQHPEEGEHFNRAMTAFSTMDAPAVADVYDFSGIEQLTDVGGGHGLLLTTILERYPSMTATLFEQPQVIRSVAGRLSPKVAGRIRLVEGDMFASIPPGAGAYIMKRILHDWPDEMCRKILTGCRAGIREGGKLIVVDAVVPAGNEFSPAKLMDLTMMLLGGKERTQEEFRTLFAASGWKLSRVIPTASQLSVVEGVPL